MKTGRIVKNPPHIREDSRWLECYPTINECKEYNKISPEDRTWAPVEGEGHTKQSPRLVRLSVAREKGWVG